MPAPMHCPCGTGLAYAACCGRWHVGTSALQAPDAEALMRSRYSAYVMALADYLLATWHPRTRPVKIDPDPGRRWLGLKVLRHAPAGAREATVEFVARSRSAGVAGGRALRLHETSRFERIDGRWYYVDGELHGAPDSSA